MGLKEQLFGKTTVARVQACPEYQYTNPQGRKPQGIARILQSYIAPDQKLVVEIPVARREQKGKTSLRYAAYLATRRTQETGRKNIFLATHDDLLMEHFPLSWDTTWQPPLGTEWHVPGTTAHFTTIPFLEQIEGALLFWYESHKYPQETEELRRERFKQEVKAIPLLERLSSKELEARVKVNGHHFWTAVASRSTRKPHVGAVYHVPLHRDHVGYIWRQLYWRGGSTYNQVLQAGQPSIEQRKRFGRRTLVTAEQIAQLHKVVEHLRHEGNMVAWTYAPVLRFHKRMFDFYANLHRVVLQLPGEKARLLHDDEKGALIGYMLRNNNRQPYAILSPKARMEQYDLRELQVKV